MSTAPTGIPREEASAARERSVTTSNTACSSASSSSASDSMSQPPPQQHERTLDPSAMQESESLPLPRPASPAAAETDATLRAMHTRLRELQQRSSEAEDTALTLKLDTIRHRDEHQRAVAVLSEDVLRLERLLQQSKSAERDLVERLEAADAVQRRTTEELQRWKTEAEAQRGQAALYKQRSADCDRLARELTHWQKTCAVTAAEQVSLESEKLALAARVEELEARLLTASDTARGTAGTGGFDQPSQAGDNAGVAEVLTENVQLQARVAQLEAELTRRQLAQKTLKDAKVYFERKCEDLSSRNDNLEALLAREQSRGAQGDECNNEEGRAPHHRRQKEQDNSTEQQSQRTREKQRSKEKRLKAELATLKGLFNVACTRVHQTASAIQVGSVNPSYINNLSPALASTEQQKLGCVDQLLLLVAERVEALAEERDALKRSCSGVAERAPETNAGHDGLLQSHDKCSDFAFNSSECGGAEIHRDPQDECGLRRNAVDRSTSMTSSDGGEQPSVSSSAAPQRSFHDAAQQTSTASSFIRSGEPQEPLKPDEILVAAVTASLKKSALLLSNAIREHTTRRKPLNTSRRSSGAIQGATTKRNADASTSPAAQDHTEEEEQQDVFTRAECVRQQILELLPVVRQTKSSSEAKLRVSLTNLQLAETELQKTRERLNKVEKDAAEELRHKATEYQKRVDRGERALERLREEHDTLQSELGTVQGELEKVRSELQIMAEKAQGYRRTIAELQDHTEVLSLQSASHKALQDELQSALVESKEQVTRLQGSEAALRHTVEERTIIADKATEMARRLRILLEQVLRMVVLLLLNHNTLLSSSRAAQQAGAAGFMAVHPPPSPHATITPTKTSDADPSTSESLVALSVARLLPPALRPKRDTSRPNLSRAEMSAVASGSAPARSASRTPRSRLRKILLIVTGVTRMRMQARRRVELHNRQLTLNVLMMSAQQHNKDHEHSTDDADPWHRSTRDDTGLDGYRSSRVRFLTPTKKKKSVTDTSLCHTPKVVFFPEDAKFSEFSPTHRPLFQDPSTPEMLANTATELGTTALPLYRIFSLEVSRLLEMITTCGVLPSIQLPDLTEMNNFLERQEKAAARDHFSAVKASGSNTAASGGGTAGDCFTLLDYLFTNASLEISDPANVYALQRSTVIPRKELRHRHTSPASPVTAAHGASSISSRQPKRLTEFETQALDNLERHLKDCQSTITEKESQLDSQVDTIKRLKEQLSTLQTTLETRDDEQQSIAASLAALETEVHSRPTREELESLRQQLLASREQYRQEREQRRAAEAEAAACRSEQVALLGEQQQLKNELRSLNIELRRAYDEQHSHSLGSATAPVLATAAPLSTPVSYTNSKYQDAKNRSSSSSNERAALAALGLRKRTEEESLEEQQRRIAAVPSRPRLSDNAASLQDPHHSVHKHPYGEAPPEPPRPRPSPRLVSPAIDRDSVLLDDGADDDTATPHPTGGGGGESGANASEPPQSSYSSIPEVGLQRSYAPTSTAARSTEARSTSLIGGRDYYHIALRSDGRDATNSAPTVQTASRSSPTTLELYRPRSVHLPD